jgi:uncharacterized coiled-coil protein SlyX
MKHHSKIEIRVKTLEQTVARQGQMIRDMMNQINGITQSQNMVLSFFERAMKQARETEGRLVLTPDELRRQEGL